MLLENKVKGIPTLLDGLLVACVTHPKVLLADNQFEWISPSLAAEFSFFKNRNVNAQTKSSTYKLDFIEREVWDEFYPLLKLAFKISYVTNSFYQHQSKDLVLSFKDKIKGHCQSLDLEQLIHVGNTAIILGIKDLIAIIQPIRYMKALEPVLKQGHTCLVNRATGVMQDPLHWAAKEGHLACVKALIPHVGSCEDKPSAFYEDLMPLDLAEKYGHTACAEALLAVGATRKSSSKNIFEAARMGDIAFLEGISQEDIDRKYNPKRTFGGKDLHYWQMRENTPLEIAAMYGQCAFLKQLIALGANVNRGTALYHAAKDHQCLFALVDAGAAWGPFNKKGRMLLHSLLYHKNADVFFGHVIKTCTEVITLQGANHTVEVPIIYAEVLPDLKKALKKGEGSIEVPRLSAFAWSVLELHLPLLYKLAILIKLEAQDTAERERQDKRKSSIDFSLLDNIKVVNQAIANLKRSLRSDLMNLGLPQVTELDKLAQALECSLLQESTQEVRHELELPQVREALAQQPVPNEEILLSLRLAGNKRVSASKEALTFISETIKDHPTVDDGVIRFSAISPEVGALIIKQLSLLHVLIWINKYDCTEKTKEVLSEHYLTQLKEDYENQDCLLLAKLIAAAHYLGIDVLIPTASEVCFRKAAQAIDTTMETARRRSRKQTEKDRIIKELLAELPTPLRENARNVIEEHSTGDNGS